MKELKVNSTSIGISYSSNSFSAYELFSRGNKLEYLNILNINDLILEIKPYDLKDKEDYEKAIDDFL